MEKGSFEARLWVKDYIHPRKSLPVVGAIHDFIIYRKICVTCTDEEVYQLNNLIQKYGMNNGLRMGLNEIRRKVITEDNNKKYQIEQLANSSPSTIAYETRKFEEELEESKLEQGLTVKQLQLRNGKYPNGMNMIPEAVLTLQKVINKGVHKNIVQYTLYDKVYGCWSAKITAPFIQPIIIRQNSLALTKNWVNIMVERAYIDSIKIKGQIAIAAEKERTAKEKEEMLAQEQISKVKRILGQDNRDNNLNTPDIF